MSVRYVWQPKGNNTTVYYRKRIPENLRRHYNNRVYKVVSTKVKNKQSALAPILKINSAVEQEWQNLRANPNSSVIKRAITYLEEDGSYDVENHQEFYPGAKRDHFESVAQMCQHSQMTKTFSPRVELSRLTFTVQTPDGVKRMRVCTSCIQANKIQKPVF
jgi:hypothetical protein